MSKNSKSFDKYNELNKVGDIRKSKIELTMDEESILNHIQLALNKVNEKINKKMLVKIYVPYLSVLEDYVKLQKSFNDEIDKLRIDSIFDKIVNNIKNKVALKIGNIDTRYQAADLNKMSVKQIESMYIGDVLGYMTSILINTYNNLRHKNLT